MERIKTPRETPFRIDFNEIREGISIRETLNYLGIKEHKGFFSCPCHPDNHPSASISNKKNRWKCFSCGQGGSNIDLVMYALGLSEYDSSILLGKEFHIGLEEISEAEIEDNSPILSKETLAKLGLEKNPYVRGSFRSQINDYKVSGIYELSKIEATEMLINKCDEYMESQKEYQKDLIEHYPFLAYDMLFHAGVEKEIEKMSLLKDSLLIYYETQKETETPTKTVTRGCEEPVDREAEYELC